MNAPDSKDQENNAHPFAATPNEGMNGQLTVLIKELTFTISIDPDVGV